MLVINLLKIFQLQGKYVLWQKLTSTIERLKEVATSPTKIGKCLSELRSAEKIARHDLYNCLGKIKF